MGNKKSNSVKTRKSSFAKSIPHFDRKISELSNEERCELIAELSESILEDPQAAFTTPNNNNNSRGSTSNNDNDGNKGKGKGKGKTKGNDDNNNNDDNGNDESDDVDDDSSYLASHSKMRRLLDLANLTNKATKNCAKDTTGSTTNHLDISNDVVTSRLATLSLLAVFQDILPTYRIRLPTAAERSVRVTKETKQLWDYERSLLVSYQQYLNILNRLWEGGYGSSSSNKSSTSQISLSLSITSILCLCELLKSAPHFNFRSNILTIVVRNMINNTTHEVYASCCNAISQLFKTDAQGEIALEATRLLAKLIKERQERHTNQRGTGSGNRIKPDVLRTFLSLPLRVHEDEAQAAKLAASAKNKKRKRDRDRDVENELAVDSKGLEDDMREGEATVDKIILARSQADTLHLVTLTYFRILKGVDDLLSSFSEDDDDDNVRTIEGGPNPNKKVTGNRGGGQYKQNRTNRIEAATQLLAPALEGLAKFAHLINFDTVVDLLKVLKGLLKNVHILPLDASLNCVLTAFQTLQGPGRELQIDQKEYVNPLYNQLPRLATTTDDNIHTTQLALKCLYVAFIKRKEHSTTRVAAFIKQLSTVSLHAPPHTSAPLLAFTRQLLQRYPSTLQLLENEQDVVASGTYSPHVEDSEHSNPFATSLWELGNLRFGIDSRVVGHAVGAAEGKMLALPVEEPGRICSEIGRDWGEGYIAHRVGGGMKRHPLAHKKGKDSTSRSSRRRRQQVRFITPRNTDHLKDFIFFS